MQDKKISRFPIPKLGELPDDIKNQFISVQEKIGFVPNVALAATEFANVGLLVVPSIKNTPLCTPTKSASFALVKSIPPSLPSSVVEKPESWI